MKIDHTVLGKLLPFHLIFRKDGAVIGQGETLKKCIGALKNVSEDLIGYRFKGSVPDCSIFSLASTGERFFIEIRNLPHLPLRAHGALVNSQTALLNCSYGILTPSAVCTHDLTEQDFTPADLVTEILFLKEAASLAQRNLDSMNQLLKSAWEVAAESAERDPLTGLLNRRGVRRRLSMIKNHAPAGIAVAHIDLDNFKAINDTFGHAVGDSVLQEVARKIQNTFRANDLCCRIGGDEFLVIITSCVSEGSLENRLKGLLNSIRGECMFGVKFGASIGAIITEGVISLDVEKLIDAADDLLYESKRSGKGIVSIRRINQGFAVPSKG